MLVILFTITFSRLPFDLWCVIYFLIHWEFLNFLTKLSVFLR